MKNMEINKLYLEGKLKKFREDHQIATTNMNNSSIMVRKLEGAIESIQILLSELENAKKPGGKE